MKEDSGHLGEKRRNIYRTKAFTSLEVKKLIVTHSIKLEPLIIELL